MAADRTLSTKVILAYREGSPKIQIQKEASVKVRQLTVDFLQSVADQCREFAAVKDRKTYKLLDTVNATAKVLRTLHGRTVEVSAFIENVLGGPVPVKEGGVHR